MTLPSGERPGGELADRDGLGSSGFDGGYPTLCLYTLYRHMIVDAFGHGFPFLLDWPFSLAWCTCLLGASSSMVGSVLLG